GPPASARAAPCERPRPRVWSAWGGPSSGHSAARRSANRARSLRAWRRPRPGRRNVVGTRGKRKRSTAWHITRAYDGVSRRRDAYALPKVLSRPIAVLLGRFYWSRGAFGWPSAHAKNYRGH